MNPIEWLEAYAPGFGELGDDERAAIMHFALLWSLFEDRVLRNSASADRIGAKVQQWADNDRLERNDFADTLAYMRERYVAIGEMTHHFGHLNLRRNDSPERVEAVLRGTTDSIIEAVTAILIIVYRYRNNLFHGQKWAYGISGQFNNFKHANETLMKVLAIDSLEPRQ